MTNAEIDPNEEGRSAPASRHVEGSASNRARADNIEEFARLFLRRAALERDPERNADSIQATRAAMSRLARGVQYDLDGLGDAFALVTLAQGEVGSPQRVLTLTYALASAPAVDYEPVAEALLDRLDGAARQFRSGVVRDDRDRRRRSRRMRRRSRRLALLGGIALAVIVVYAAGLGFCGSWGAKRDRIELPPPTATTPASASTAVLG